MPKFLVHAYYGNVIDSLIAFAVLLLLTAIINLVYAKRVKNRTKRKRFRIRSLYILVLLLLFFMARIWIEGFSHFLAVLGFLSAALVIANKETIMNMTGFLVITWRDLFVEEDLIQVLSHKGYVKSIGILYFGLSEVREHSNNTVTGKVIKIPNGLLITNPIVNYSTVTRPIKQRLSIIVTKESNSDATRELLKQLIDTIIAEYYKDNRQFDSKRFKKDSPNLARAMELGTVVTMQPKQTVPTGLEVTANYYCFARDQETIEQEIWHQLLAILKTAVDIHLSYE